MQITLDELLLSVVLGMEVRGMEWERKGEESLSLIGMARKLTGPEPSV